ncbi:hypothetical protein [Laribacter hongkongensis]|uniref:hypothetical protein n=1 Tax=Laribacter hongkongensis TaxID=168471 RepID=UPI001EFCDBD3|nr:hypothetical protein [Laribacter hongkongensis]MCG9095185.1 hypothetical protein [Laribacter hongkongensis]
MLDPQEERAKFISLHELLFILAEAKGYSPQQAAQSLGITMAQDPKWQQLKLHRFDPAMGMISTTVIEANEARERLALLARTGDTKTVSERDSDEILF